MQTSELQLFEWSYGQKLCVAVAQDCINRLEHIPAVTDYDLRRRAELSRIIDACREIYRELEQEARHGHAMAGIGGIDAG